MLHIITIILYFCGFLLMPISFASLADNIESNDLQSTREAAKKYYTKLPEEINSKLSAQIQNQDYKIDDYKEIVTDLENKIKLAGQEVENPKKEERNNKTQSFQTKTSSCNSNKEGLMIFVSFSMPKNLLIELGSIAKKLGAKLLFRGLKNNSFKETVKYLKENSIRASLDPVAFSRFEIKLVPAFVLSSGSVFDKMSGNVSALFALENFALIGETKELAKQYLKEAKNDL